MLFGVLMQHLSHEYLKNLSERGEVGVREGDLREIKIIFGKSMISKVKLDALLITHKIFGP